MIQISTLGTFSVCADEAIVPDRLGDRGRELAAFLVVNPDRFHRRESLMELFWGHLEEAKARRSMSNALWRLRKIVGKHAGSSPHETFDCQARHVAFRSSDHIGVDATDFASAVSGIWTRYKADPVGLNAPVRESLSKALHLYHGPFFEQCDADWAVAVRHEMESLYVRGMMILKSDFTQKHFYEDAIECACQILRVDPHRETVQRDLMRLYILTGQQARALEHYCSYRALLAEEFGVNPMLSTTNLYNKIIKGDALSYVDQDEAIIEAM